MPRIQWVKWTMAVTIASSLPLGSISSPVAGLRAVEAAPASEKGSAGDLALAPNAKSAILIDGTTGQILFEKNAHQKLPPASVTKIMTLLLAMEAIDNGRIKLADKIRTSDHASSMGGSQVFLEPGEEMTLDDMLKAIALASANDAAVAVAEHISGSEQEFVRVMNEKAQALGCKDTHFVNTNGLPVADHYTSAYDLALISKELLNHPIILNYTKKYEDYLRKDTSKPFWLVNTNKMVKWYPGMEGLKTGFTSEARFCLAAAAKRGDLRVISVVMGEPTSKMRNAEVASMMDWAFANYTSKLLYAPKQIAQTIKIPNGKITKLPLLAAKPVAILLKKGEKLDQFTSEIVLDKIKAPIAKDSVVGHILVKKQGVEVTRVPLLAGVNIDKATWWELTKRNLIKWLTFGSAGQD